MKIMDKFSLRGKSALVTGGAGKYGKQILRALGEAQAQVYIASRNIEALDKVADEYCKKGYDVTALQFDQSDEMSINQLKDRILHRSGRIDVLVNNSVSRPMSGWDDTANFAESMKVNATGLFIVTKVFGDVMAKQGSGSIINIGSIYGIVGSDKTLYEGLGFDGFYPDYYFNKGGMINLTRAVASYYGQRNVRCNCVSPGGLETENTDEEFIRRYSSRTFLNRMADDKDLMGIIVFLASDASLYITGTNIPVDGGFTAK